MNFHIDSQEVIGLPGKVIYMKILKSKHIAEMIQKKFNDDDFETSS